MTERIYINWREAKGPELSDHAVGDLCKDSAGEVYLIGDVEKDSDYDGGCGCCSNRITKNKIVAYAPLLEYVAVV